MRPITDAKFLTDQEREQLIELLDNHIGDRNSIMIRLTLYTASRGCEVVQLTVNSFNFNESTVTVKGAKGSNNRTIPLPPKFSKEIKTYCEDNGITNRLFPISTRQFRRIWDFWRPNPRKGAHSLRHTGGILLYINCRDINIVRALLGHKQINNTMVYLDFVEGPRKLRTAMRGMWNRKINEE